MNQHNNIFLNFLLTQFLLLCLTLPQTVFSQPANSSWPLDRHDAKNTGYSSYAGPSNGILKWQYLLPSNVVSASPVIDTDGTIYISNAGSVFAINPDGSQKWQLTLNSGGTCDCSPAISGDGTIYIPSGKNDFYALNPDGTLKWTYKAPNSFQYSSPTIGQDGTIYVGCNLDLLAISPDGSLLWKYRVGENISSTPAIALDGTIYVRSRTKYLCAINSDGSLKWKIELGSVTSGGGLSPVIADDGTIFTNGTVSYASDYNVWDVNGLFAINPDGTIKWSFNSISPAGTGTGGFVPAIDPSGNIYLGGEVNDLLNTSAFFALNSSGNLLWSYQLPSAVNLGKSSPTVDVNGVIYFGATDLLYSLNPDGSLKWKLKTDIGGSSPSIGYSGMIYYGSGDGYLNAIDDISSDNTPSGIMPDIKANNSDGPLIVQKGAMVTITISLGLSGKDVQDSDWWVAQETSSGWNYLNIIDNKWLAGLGPTYQGALASLSSFQILNSSDLSPGIYTYYFGIDTIMNGSIDPSQLIYDSITIEVK